MTKGLGLLTVQEYEALGYKQLHRELKKMVVMSTRVVKWMNDDKKKLLPALMAMKNLVSQPGRRYVVTGQPSWQEECLLLGLSAEQVRQWKHRTASETDIRALLGEEHEAAAPRPPAPSREYHRLVMLTQAVFNGDFDQAEKLAAQYVEEYGI